MALRAQFAAAALLMVLATAPAVATSAPPPGVPAAKPVYSMPMAVIQGRGTIRFKVTFGMLVTEGGSPVGLYRTYPSKSPVPLGEQWDLGASESPAGVILASQGNTAVLILHGRIAAGVGTYPLTLTYLANAAEHQYASCTIRVAHEPNGQWLTVDAGGHHIDTYTVVSRGLGISNIEGCSK